MSWAKSFVFPAAAAMVATCVSACSDQRVDKSSGPPAIITTPFQTSPGTARFLYVVVDSDGIYFGEERTEPKFALAVLEALLAKETVRNVSVFPTERAAHGVFVSFWGSINRRKYFVASLESIPLRRDSRLPLVGTVRRHFEGGWQDVDHQHIWIP